MTEERWNKMLDLTGVPVETWGNYKIVVTPEACRVKYRYRAIVRIFFGSYPLFSNAERYGHIVEKQIIPCCYKIFNVIYIHPAFWAILKMNLKPPSSPFTKGGQEEDS